uniref:Transmembrane protein 218 n=1 Tax=Angiostrongylus cantonensis TaxID=6313 RepID=A0A0K0DI94_ANGCA
MVRIVTDGDYAPWYSRRSCPVFCYPCVPAYMGVWPARRCVLIVGAVLFFVGVMILLAMLLTCIAVECSNIAGALVPLGLILIIVGILLFHCGWAAHLLDDSGQVPIK